MLKRVAAVLLAVLPLVACDGPIGPAGQDGLDGGQGAQGIQGPPGPAGPGTRLNYFRTLGADGATTQALPAAVGTNPQLPPVFGCYTSSSLSGTWLVVADGRYSTDLSCGLVFGNGVWNAVMLHGVPGWWAAFVVVY